jgi:DNA-binding transcriptional regulator YiaG
MVQTDLIERGSMATPARKRRLGTSRAKVILRKPVKLPDADRFSDMNEEEFEEKLKENSVSQQQFARITGVAPTTVRRWCSKKWRGKIPFWVELLFELFKAKPSVALRSIGRSGPRPVDMDFRPKTAGDISSGF